MIVTTVVLTNAAQAKCFHSQCRSRMYAVTHQILNLNCVLSLEPKWRSMELVKQHQQGPQNSYPISARGLEGFNRLGVWGWGFGVEGGGFVGGSWLWLSGQPLKCR